MLQNRIDCLDLGWRFGVALDTTHRGVYNLFQDGDQKRGTVNTHLEGNWKCIQRSFTVCEKISSEGIQTA